MNTPDRIFIGFRIDVVVEPDEIGFHAYCPALKGLHASGDTEEEAPQNAKDAATAYIQYLIKHRDPIPVGVVVRQETKRLSSKTRYRTEDLAVACA
jgi:predicted RNase H-like HicB family nuclease